MATEVKRSQIEDADGSSWGTLAVEDDSQWSGIGTLLVQKRAGGGRGREGGQEGRGREEEGERGVKQQKQWKNKLSRTNRGVGGVCVRVVPRVLSKLSRALRAHRGKTLLQDVPNLKSTAMKRAMVRFRGAREKSPCHLWNAWGFRKKT